MVKYKNFGFLVGTLSLIILIAACPTTPVKTTDSSTWSSRMQAFGQNIYILFPLASDPVAFKDPKNHNTIDTSLTVFALMAHDMSKDLSDENIKAANIDPAVKVLAGTFKRDLNTAVDAFRKGDYEDARVSTRGALQLCIQCHARKPNDQKRVVLLDPGRLALMKPLFRADILAAARQFDQSLAVYNEVIQDQSLVKAHSMEWQEAAQRAVAISVRAKGDPNATERIVDSVLKSDGAPRYFLEEARLWKDQIKEWKSDSRRIKMGADDYEKAKILMRIAFQENLPPYENYGSSYIYFLRASSYLHSYLQNVTDPALAANAYLLLGRCYEVLKDTGEVGLSKNYYKSCILTAPHTPTALQCYDRYEETSYVDALSSASELPLSTVDYLEYLKGLASP